MATLSASAPFPTITLDLTQAPGGVAGSGGGLLPHGLHRPPGLAAPAMPFQAPSPLAMFLPQRAPAGSMPMPAGLVARQQQSVMETVTAAIAADPNFTTALAAAISSVMAGAAHQGQPTPRGSQIGITGDQANGGAGAATAGPTAAGAHAAPGGSSPRFATQSCTTSTT